VFGWLRGYVGLQVGLFIGYSFSPYMCECMSGMNYSLIQLIADRSFPTMQPV